MNTDALQGIPYEHESVDSIRRDLVESDDSQRKPAKRDDQVSESPIIAATDH
jgi:hypothetical protein